MACDYMYVEVLSFFCYTDVLNRKLFSEASLFEVARLKDYKGIHRTILLYGLVAFLCVIMLWLEHLSNLGEGLNLERQL